MTRATAERAGSYDANRVDPQQLANMKQAQELSDSNYSAMDFGEQVLGFPEKLYQNADRDVRGLIGLLGATGSNVLNDQAPFEGVEADPIIGEMLHNFTHPVEYANENPLDFSLDLAGAGALGAHALESGAARWGGSVPEWLGSETGAIGPFGKKMEALASEGYEADAVRNATMGWGDNTPGMVPSAEPFYDATGHVREYRPRNTAAAPNYGPVDLMGPEGEMTTGMALLKPGPGEARFQMDQIGGELAYQELNRRLGNIVDMPGSIRADFDYAPVKVTDVGPGGPQRFHSTVPDDLSPTNGLAIEEVQGAIDAGHNNPALLGMQNKDAINRMTLMDYIAGNTDRDFATGHNVMLYDDGKPLAIDHGISGKSANDYYADPGPGVVPPGWGAGQDFDAQLWMGAQPTSQQWPGYTLSPEHVGILENAIEVLRGSMNDMNPISENWGLDNIEAAISRSENALARGKLFADHPFLNQQPPDWANNAFGDIEQPGWMQLQKAIMEEAGSPAGLTTPGSTGVGFGASEEASSLSPVGPGLMAELNAAIDAMRQRGFGNG